MTGSVEHRRRNLAWLVAVLVAVLVGVPFADSFVCEADSAPPATTAAAASMIESGAKVVSGASNSSQDLHGGKAEGGAIACFHGHCHHAGVGAPATALALDAPHAKPDIGLAMTTPILHSTALSPTKPPPRA